MLALSEALQAAGFSKAHIFLDNNPTHKQKMQDFFRTKAKGLEIQVVFAYLPRYSPKLNLVEYLIHLVRQKCLHHADHKRDLKQVEKQLVELLHHKQFVPQYQLINILQHIQNLVIQT